MPESIPYSKYACVGKYLACFRDFTLSRVIVSHPLMNEVTAGGREFILSSSPLTYFVNGWRVCCV